MQTSNENSATDATTTQFTQITQRGIQLNQRPTTSRSTKCKPLTKFTAGDEVIQEDGWTLDQTLQRFKYVDTMPVPSSATSHTILGKFKVPQDLYANNRTTEAPFQNFQFWNGKAEVYAQITASPTAQGCVAMVFVPLTSDRAIEANHVFNFSALTVNQCAFLFPNTNTSAEMQIDYNSPYSNLRVSETGTADQHTSLGYLYFIVFNPMQLSTSSSDNISISLFTRFTDNAFKVPEEAGVTVRKVKAQGEEITVSKPTSENLIEKVAGLVLPENVVGDAIDMVGKATSALSLFGLDNPVISKQQEPVKVLTVQHLNFARGPEYIDKLTWDPSSVPTVQESTFATTQDEMEMQYLTSKFSYLGTCTMTNANAIGDTLASFPMNPCPDRVANGALTSPTLLQYLATPWEYWSGGLVIKIQVVATMMQTGKVIIALNYGKFAPDVSNNLDLATSQYGQIIELNQGSNVYEMTMQYLAPTPFLHVPSSNQPSNFDTMGYVNVSVLNPLVSTNGAPSEIKLNFFLAGAPDFRFSTLTATKNLQPFVPFQLAKTVKQKRIKHVIEQEVEDSDSDIGVEIVEVVKRPPRVKVRAQSAVQPTITPISEVDVVTENNVISKSQNIKEGMIVAQPFIPGIRELLRKYQMAESILLPTVAADAMHDVHRIRLHDLFGRSAISPSVSLPTATATLPPLGNFTWAQLMYRQYSGGFNFKIMAETSDKTDRFTEFSVFYQPPSFNANSTDADLTEVLKNQLFMQPTNPDVYNSRVDFQYPGLTRLPIHYINGINRTAEFHVPFSTRFLSVLSTLGANCENELLSSELINLGSIYICHKSRTTINYLNVFFSLSDESRFGTLFNVPQLSPISYRNSLTGAILSSSAGDDYGSGAPIANTLVKL